MDTNIVIDALNGVKEADTEFNRYERVLISQVTWMEILVGTTDKKEETQLRDFLESNFEIIPLDGTVAEMAINMRREYRMRLPDAVIWATAKTNDAVLVTRNAKDFKVEWGDIRLPYSL